MQFGTWLRDARAQERDRGVSHRELVSQPVMLTEYMQDHMARALQNMEELYAQFPAAAHDEARQREIWEALREPFVIRMREALDHIGAVLTVVCTTEELERAGCDEESPESAPEDEKVDKEPPEETAEPDLEETVHVPLPVVASADNGTEK